MADDAPNPRIFEGANNPPADPFAIAKAKCDDVYAEAKHWLDGAAITNDAEAEAVERLLEMARKAYTEADDARVAENKPFDDGKKAVQEKYAPLIADTKATKGSMVRLQDACKAVLTPWRTQKQREAQAAAEEARKAAAERAAEAAAAAQAAAGNLAEAEVAEELERQALAAQRDAARAEKAVTTGTGLTTYYEAVMTDQKAAVLHYMKAQPAEFIALVQRLAATDVREGKRTIPGFTVEERKRAR